MCNSCTTTHFINENFEFAGNIFQFPAKIASESAPTSTFFISTIYSNHRFIQAFITSAVLSNWIGAAARKLNWEHRKVIPNVLTIFPNWCTDISINSKHHFKRWTLPRPCKAWTMASSFGLHQFICNDIYSGKLLFPKTTCQRELCPWSWEKDRPKLSTF